MNYKFLAVLAAGIALVGVPMAAQEPVMQQLQKRFSQRATASEDSNGGQIMGNSNLDTDSSSAQTGIATEKSSFAGLQVAIWRPDAKAIPAPLVIFSHGFHGKNTQSIFFAEALAQAGYLVIAPNHEDAGFRAPFKPQLSFLQSANWNDQVYKDRRDDIKKLLEALRADRKWNSQIDWSKLALAGHSLGGYTVLGLGGAWPSWKLPEVKAVIALSPYCQPFVLNGNLSHIGIPVMYQGGTRDTNVTPTVERSGGAYEKTGAPCEFVEFDNVNHFGFTELNRDQAQRQLIAHYAVAFLDKYVKGDSSAKPEENMPGVARLSVK